MKTFYTIVALLLCPLLYSQNNDPFENELLNKYFNLRDQFHKMNVFVGNSHYDQNNITLKTKIYKGHNIPFNLEYGNYICRGDNFPKYWNDTLLLSGDGTIKIAWYLVYLSTEYKLLKDAGKDTKETLNEIYYTLLAIERLDNNAEDYFQKKNTLFNPSPLPDPKKANGFFIRDDFNYNFSKEVAKLLRKNPDYMRTQGAQCSLNSLGGNYWNKDNKNDTTWEAKEWLKRGHFNDLYDCKTNTELGYVINPKIIDANGAMMKNYWNAKYSDNHGGSPEMSQDQLAYLMLGLSFVNKFVDNLYVKPTDIDNGFFLIDKVKDIVHLLATNVSKETHHIETINWGDKTKTNEFITKYLLVNPVTSRFVLRGNNVTQYAYPLSVASSKITGLHYSSETKFEVKKHALDQDLLFVQNPMARWAGMYNIFLTGNSIYSASLVFPQKMAIGWAYVGSAINRSITLTYVTLDGLLNNEQLFDVIRLNVDAAGNNDPFDLVYAVYNNKTPHLDKEIVKDILKGGPCDKIDNYWNNSATNITIDSVNNSTNLEGKFIRSTNNIFGCGINTYGEFEYLETYPFAYMVMYNLYRRGCKINCVKRNFLPLTTVYIWNQTILTARN